MEQYKQILWTLLRVFFGAMVAFLISSGVGILDMGWADWKPALTAAIAAVLVVVFNLLNPKDARYGIGANK